jgi:hypothetical protein
MSIPTMHARASGGASTEAEALASGRYRTELLPSRMAVRFFSRLGYRMGGPMSLATADGRFVEAFAMAKDLKVGIPRRRPGRRTASTLGILGLKRRGPQDMTSCGPRACAQVRPVSWAGVRYLAPA